MSSYTLISKGDAGLNLSKHIREFRQRDGLSQEELAERIYVTRQTVSNWETGRSYPDVQSLLLLSVLFNVSIDELVKGDIDTMKNELEVYKLNMWALVMIVCLVVGSVALIPMYAAFGLAGLVPPAILLVAGLAVAIVVERIKKKRNLGTYAEVVAFFEGETPDPEKVAKEKEHKMKSTLLKIGGGVIAGLVLALIGLLIEKLIFG